MLKYLLLFVLSFVLVPFSGTAAETSFKISERGKKEAGNRTDIGMFFYYLQKKNEKLAVECLQRAIHDKPNVPTLALAIVEFYDNGVIPEEQFLLFVKQHPNASFMNVFAILTLQKRGKTAEAEAVLDHAIRFHLAPRENGKPPRGVLPDDDTVAVQNLFSMRINMLAEEKKWADANDFLQKIEQFCPMEYTDSYLLSLIAYFCDAMTAAPDGFVRDSLKKYCSILQKRLDGANHFKEDVSQNLLSFLNRNGEAELAESLSAESLLTDPNSPAAYRNLGRWFLEQNDIENALRSKEREFFVLRKDNLTPDRQFLLQYMRLLLQGNDPEKVKSLAKLLAGQKGLDDPLLSAVADFFLQRNLLREAAYFTSLVQSHMIKELLLADLLRRQKKYREALRLYLKLERANPDMDYYKYMVLETASKAGAADIEEQFMNELLLKSENNPDYQNTLSYLWAEKGINLDQAEKLVRSALKKYPENAAYLDTLAWVLYRKKQYPQAKMEILKALERFPDGMNKGVLLDHAGDIFHALGETEHAKSYWQKAVQSGDPELDMKKVLEKLPKPVIHELIPAVQTPESKADDPKNAPQEP